ncbi:hypothetical protein [uncultured Paracoccus sp.]|uniref:hypothetical protein n=1 Tax=uncultured Paracoccus sp. TaxID=189685 RepID=UPI00260083DA|nr:hypothetical protein [uncultured Paracoccus sp.]
MSLEPDAPKVCSARYAMTLQTVRPSAISSTLRMRMTFYLAIIANQSALDNPFAHPVVKGMQHSQKEQPGNATIFQAKSRRRERPESLELRAASVRQD